MVENNVISNTNKENNNLVSQKSKTKSQQKITAGFGLEAVTAKTKNQKKFFQSYKHYPVISLSGWAGTGKAQPLDCKVLTPSGWVLMRDITPAMDIVAADGTITKVTGVFPQEGKLSCYQLTFSDGSTTKCDDQHLWTGWISHHKSRKSEYKTLTLVER